MPGDPFRLDRFVQAQAADYDQALGELRAGLKRSHWIWYILPQLRGLGFSQRSAYYGIGSLDEARAYLDHPLLGPRLRECVATLNSLSGLSAVQVLGQTDAAKCRSCLSLFMAVDGPDSVFGESLRRYFGGEPDPETLRLLGIARASPRDA